MRRLPAIRNITLGLLVEAVGETARAPLEPSPLPARPELASPVQSVVQIFTVELLCDLESKLGFASLLLFFQTELQTFCSFGYELQTRTAVTSYVLVSHLKVSIEVGFFPPLE